MQCHLHITQLCTTATHCCSPCLQLCWSHCCLPVSCHGNRYRLHCVHTIPFLSTTYLLLLPPPFHAYTCRFLQHTRSATVCQDCSHHHRSLFIPYCTTCTHNSPPCLSVVPTHGLDGWEDGFSCHHHTATFCHYVLILYLWFFEQTSQVYLYHHHTHTQPVLPLLPLFSPFLTTTTTATGPFPLLWFTTPFVYFWFATACHTHNCYDLPKILFHAL